MLLLPARELGHILEPSQSSSGKKKAETISARLLLPLVSADKADSYDRYPGRLPAQQHLTGNVWPSLFSRHSRCNLCPAEMRWMCPMDGNFSKWAQQVARIIL